MDGRNGRQKQRKINALKRTQQETASGLKDAEMLARNINKHLTVNYEV